MRIACTGPRILGEELLEKAPPLVVHENLRDLVRINRWLGGHRLVPKLLADYMRRDQEFTVLDVGAASGDMGAAIRRFYRRAHIISTDLKPLHLMHAPPSRVAADAFRLPFSPGSVDIVFCSLFLHHFGAADAAELLRRFRTVARCAVIVIDLERHPLAYYFLPATRWLFRWSDLVVHDGKISVEAAWKPNELRRLAREAGLCRARVRRHRPWFRLSVSAAV